jgi:hypothetical protein
MLTLAMPAGVITAKSGREVRVCGEPVHEARQDRSRR